jgi:hypothetical protein
MTRVDWDILESKVRDRVSRYLDGDWSLRTLYGWLVANCYDCHKSDSGSLKSLVYGLRTVLAEHTSGRRTEESLKQGFSDLLKS